MEASDAMEDLPFREVVLAASGHKVLPGGSVAALDQTLLDHASTACAELLKWMSTAESPIRRPAPDQRSQPTG